MAQSAATAWTACIKELQALIKQNPDDRKAAVLSSNKLLNGPWPEHPLPKATWRKLVLELKVPQQLSQLCSTAAQQRPRTAAVVAAFAALDSFLVKASSDGVLSRAKHASGNTVYDAICQQVEQSGVLQHLPAVLAAAADELETMPRVLGLMTLPGSTTGTAATSAASRTAAAAAASSGRTSSSNGLGNIVPPRPGCTPNNSTGITAAGGSSSSPGTGPQSAYCQQVETHSQQLLSLLGTCLQEWPLASMAEGSQLNAALQAAAAEAFRLFMGCMQRLSSSMQEQKVRVRASDLWNKLNMARLGLGIVNRMSLIVSTSCHDEAASADRTEGAPAMQQQPQVLGQACQVLLGSPHTLPALVTAITVFGYGSVLAGDRPLPTQLPGAVASASAGGSAAPTAAADSSQRHSHAGPDKAALPQPSTTHASSSKSSPPQPASTLRAEALVCSGDKTGCAGGPNCSHRFLSLLLSGSTSEVLRQLQCTFYAATSLEPVVTPCQQELLQLLGLHPWATLMAAAHICVGLEVQAVQQCIKHMCELLNPASKLLLGRADQHSDAMGQPESQQPAASSDVHSLPPSSQGLTQSGAPSAQLQQKETVGQLLLLLPTVLLQCAAEQPAGSQQFTRACVCAAVSSCSALLGGQGIRRPHVGTGSSSLMQQPYCWERLPSSRFEEMLSVVLKLLLQLLEQDQAHPVTEAAATTQLLQELRENHMSLTQPPTSGSSAGSASSSSTSGPGMKTCSSSHGGKKDKGSGKAAQLPRAGNPQPQLPGPQAGLSDSKLRQSAILSLNAVLNTLLMHVVTDPAEPETQTATSPNHQLPAATISPGMPFGAPPPGMPVVPPGGIFPPHMPPHLQPAMQQPAAQQQQQPAQQQQQHPKPERTKHLRAKRKSYVIGVTCKSTWTKPEALMTPEAQSAAAQPAGAPASAGSLSAFKAPLPAQPAVKQGTPVGPVTPRASDATSSSAATSSAADLSPGGSLAAAVSSRPPVQQPSLPASKEAARSNAGQAAAAAAAAAATTVPPAVLTALQCFSK